MVRKLGWGEVRASSTCFVATLAAASALGVVPGAATDSVFRVDQGTQHSQIRPAIAVGANGRFVVAWQDNSPRDGDESAIVARLFDADATPLGDEIQVNTTAAGFQLSPRVAAGTEGEFVVLWESVATDGSGSDVFGQRLGADGAPLGNEFRVNANTEISQGNNGNLDVAAAAGGGFIAVWSQARQNPDGTLVLGQRFDRAGDRLGDEFRVNVTNTFDVCHPRVATDTEGNFVVAWTDESEDSGDIAARLFDRDGAALGGDIRVNQITDGEQGRPLALARSPEGDFAVAWDTRYEDDEGERQGRVSVRIFASTGLPRLGEFAVNTAPQTDGEVIGIAASADRGGRFLFAWAGYDEQSDDRVFAQRLQADGSKDGAEFLVDASAIDTVEPTASFSPTGGLVVAWQAPGGINGSGIFARRLTAPALPCPGDCNGDGRVSIAELVTGVNIALGAQPISSCTALDTNGDEQVSIAEIIAAVGRALAGCS